MEDGLVLVGETVKNGILRVVLILVVMEDGLVQCKDFAIKFNMVS